MATASVGVVNVGDNARLPFGWDEPDPADPTGQTRRVKNISTYTVTFEARLRQGDPILFSKSSEVGATEIDVDVPAGETWADGTFHNGYVILDTDDLETIGDTTDLYCILRITKTGERHTTGFRLQARVLA
jgi:hypothetical protein